MTLREHFDHLLTSFINWKFRSRPIASTMIATGGLCLTAAVGGGFVIKGTLPTSNGGISVGFSTAGGPPMTLIIAAGIIGIVLILGGLILGIRASYAEQKALLRKKVIVIEIRGLRDGVGVPLAGAVSQPGHKDELIIDLRQNVRDGVIISPTRALEKLSHIQDDLAQRESGLDRKDLARAYGGLAPVPLTFLSGVLLDDESMTTIYDWSRHDKTWRLLDEPDDGHRFECLGLEGIPIGATDVALLVSTSYALDKDGIDAKVGAMPKVSLRLTNAGPDAHWSEEKQRALGKQFFDIAMALGDKGVRQIHLFLAAQNSLVYRFGTLYDKRNLPQILVYQYDKAHNPPYPWAIGMPVGVVSKACVEMSSDFKRALGANM